MITRLIYQIANVKKIIVQGVILNFPIKRNKAKLFLLIERNRV